MAAEAPAAHRVALDHRSSGRLRDVSRGRNVAGWLFPGYLAIIFTGYELLRWQLPNGQGAVQALFTAVNAATLTSLQTQISPEKFGRGAQITLLGLMLSGSFLSMLLGAMAVTRICRLPFSDRRIAVADLVAHAVFIGIGMLSLSFKQTRTAWQGFFLAASSFCNSGLHIGGLPGIASAPTHAVVLPLSVLGSVGLPVLMELVDFIIRKRPLSIHSKTVLKMTACVYLAGALLLMTCRASAIRTGYGLPDAFEQVRVQLASSAAQAVNCRTAGFAFEPLKQVPHPAYWLFMILMCIGGASAGSAGGLKCNSLAVLIRGIRALAAQRMPARSFFIAITWLGGYLLTVLLCVTLLSAQIPSIPGDHLLLLACSAASNVGLSLEPVDPDRVTAYILAATMLIGRFAPLVVLWWMSDSAIEASLAVA